MNPDEIPQRDKYTCLLCAFQKEGKMTLHFQKVRKNGRLLGEPLNLHFDDQGLDKAKVRSALKYLGGTQVIHFSQGEAVVYLAAQVERHAFKAMDNQFYDAAPLANEMCMTPGLPENAKIDDFTGLHGVPVEKRNTAKKCARTKLELLNIVWECVIRPAIIYAESIGPDLERDPRTIKRIDLSLCGLPLPSPIIPKMNAPASGWRCTAWGSQEALECALRLANGATLEDLATVFRRSPRAIQARMTIDGILQKL